MSPLYQGTFRADFAPPGISAELKRVHRSLGFQVKDNNDGVFWREICKDWLKLLKDKEWQARIQIGTLQAEVEEKTHQGVHPGSEFCFFRLQKRTAPALSSSNHGDSKSAFEPVLSPTVPLRADRPQVYCQNNKFLCPLHPSYPFPCDTGFYPRRTSLKTWRFN